MIQDLRLAVRQLRRSSGFAAVAVLTLGLGIGAITAIYTVVQNVVLDPLPYPDAERLVRLKSPVPGMEAGSEWNLSAAQYFYFREHGRSFEEIGAFQRGVVNVQGPDGPERAATAMATSGTLRLVGARPLLGRSFGPEDDLPGGPEVVLLAEGFWQRQFGADPSVVGRTLSLDGTPHEVVGVLASGLRLPGEPGAPVDLERRDLWVPYRLNPAGPFFNSHVIPVIARLRPGVEVLEAQTEADRLTSRLPDAFPDVYSADFMEEFRFGSRVVPLKEYVVGDIGRHLWLVFGAVGLVLLVACANVANLFLARAEGRRAELAIRGALGAGRWKLARHFLAETLVLSVLGGLLGLVLGLLGVEWLLALAPSTFPRLDAVAPDVGVAGFALGTSLVVSLALAAFLVVRHGGHAGASALAEQSRSSTATRERQRLRSALVAAQVALALVLVVGAGLLVASFQRLRAVDPGVEAEAVLTARVHLPASRYPDNQARWRFMDAVRHRLEALPGVAAAGFSTSLPLTGGFGCFAQFFEDSEVAARLRDAEQTNCAGLVPTTPGWLEALGIPLYAGRTLTAADNERPETGAVVVSRAFAERFWPGEDPIGKGVRPHGQDPPYYRVVGVVGDVPATSLEEPPALAAYYPVVEIPEQPSWFFETNYLAVRSEAGSPLALLPAVRGAVHEVDPTVPLAEVEELQTIVDRSMSGLSFTMVLLGVSGAVALLLAAVGLYGVISYLVARRTPELGVRLALGARPGQVERFVVTGSLRMAALGLVAGTVAALLLSRLLRGMLFEISPTHPAAYAAAALTLGGVAALAAWLPARRAARLDPARVLREG